MSEERVIWNHEPWMDQGACRADDVDPDWWSDTAPHTVSKAKRICENKCEVREQCLDWANRTRIKFVTAGGKTPQERRADRNV